MLEAQFEEAPRETAYYLSWVLLESGFVPLARGDHDAAIALFTEALELTRKMGARFQEALFVDALCWAHRSKGTTRAPSSSVARLSSSPRPRRPWSGRAGSTRRSGGRCWRRATPRRRPRRSSAG